MSTRANIVVEDSYGDRLWFYRHSDGYPSVALVPLLQFLGWRKRGLIRDNVGQSAGWLIVLGAMEYASTGHEMRNQSGLDTVLGGEFDANGDPRDWKVGAIEPTTGQHGDVEFVYIIELSEPAIICYTVDGDGKLSRFADVTDPATDPSSVESKL